MDSPPKRMTRARAAAKAGEGGARTTRIITAAAKARCLSTATASTKSTAAKRKTRADDQDDGDDELGEHNTRRATRSRPGKALDGPSGTVMAGVASSTNAIVRNSAIKRPTTETTTEGGAGTSRLRGRPRKAPSSESEGRIQEPIKRTTRTRSVTVGKAVTDETKVTMKKSVKFQEEGKENVSLASKARASGSTAGLRGRPARRAATVTSDSSSNPPSRTSDGGPKPLSPKKVTQMPVARDREVSEDELAGGEEMQLLKKSPAKPLGTQKTNKQLPNAMSDGQQDKAMTDIIAPIAAAVVTSLTSPPRRPPTSPTKDSLKSPAKRPGFSIQLPESLLQPRALSSADQHSQSAFLQSPAKRPPSPVKGSAFTSRSGEPPLPGQSMFRSSLLRSPAKRAMPGIKPVFDAEKSKDALLNRTPRMQPIVAERINNNTSGLPSQLLLAEELQGEETSDAHRDPFTGPIESPKFPGRMSAILPRFADPLLSEGVPEGEDDAEEFIVVAQPVLQAVANADVGEDILHGNSANRALKTKREGTVSEDMAAEVEDDAEFRLSKDQGSDTTFARPSASKKLSMFQLRGSILDPCSDFVSDFDSEDDLSPLKQLPAQRSSSNRRSSQTEGSVCTTKRQSRRSTMGLTDLAEQLGAWTSASPSKTAAGHAAAPNAHDGGLTASISPLETRPESEASPMKSSFFEDEILVHTEQKTPLQDSQSNDKQGIDGASVTMEDIVMTDEDVALTAEANNMSLISQHADETLSEASQEYADENELPVDPALSAKRDSTLTTPTRPFLQKSYFTTTKVPLKPAHDSEPSPSKKRSFSASRISARSAGNLSRSATVISYSPRKENKRPSILSPDDPFRTPSKGDLWSSVGTPGRTPRRDVNPGLLRGAVVFVDVHTTEGADASGIFVELLSQMGAKCVKTWHWNPNGSINGENSSSRVGITHVVFKDGGKRTMEKVRDSNGIVHCVGVSWVLDCERENEWLDESPYYIDTTLVPRGGARRRKSMEPKAIANLNGMIVSGPNKSSKPPNTPRNRRESTMWMYSPSDQGDQDDDDLEWSCALLTPVPKTPAPEAVARYAAELPETPSAEGSSSIASPSRQSFLTRTCPPKESKYHELGEGILSREKDEQVKMRLMAARRKSLQFAPKIGSPLARTWE